MDMQYEDNGRLDQTFPNRVITLQVPVDYIRVVNRQLGAEYLSRVYTIFVFQLLLSGAYVLYPAMLWSSIQVSLIISPLIVNVWDIMGLRHFYPFTLAGLLLAEFVLLEYFTFMHNIGTILVGLIIAFVLCSLIYVFTYITEKVIVLGLPPTNPALLLLVIIIISYFKNRIVFDVCSSLKNLLVIYYVLYRSDVIEPMIESQYIQAGTKLHVNFLLILASVITVLNLYV